MAFRLITGDFKSEKSNGEVSESPGGGRGASGSTRIITRLRNPDSKLSQLKSQQVAAAAHEANKVFKEGIEVCSFCLKQTSLECKIILKIEAGCLQTYIFELYFPHFESVSV